MQPTKVEGRKMLEGPKHGELPEAQETIGLLAREAAQTPDVEAICQGSPVVLPQGIDVSKHANDGCGDDVLIIAQETAENEVRHPLGISQLVGRLAQLLFQKLLQIHHLQN